MTTSVPQVRSIEDLKWECAKLLELGIEATRLSHDVSYLEKIMVPIRMTHQELKLMANLGTYDRDYVDRMGDAINKMDAFIDRHRRK
jgi:hypothetical protein